MYRNVYSEVLLMKCSEVEMGERKSSWYPIYSAGNRYSVGNVSGLSIPICIEKSIFLTTLNCT